MSGQVFCVFYALCGIPLNLAFLKQLGKCLTIQLGRLEKGMLLVVPHKVRVDDLWSFLLLLSITAGVKQDRLQGCITMPNRRLWISPSFAVLVSQPTVGGLAVSLFFITGSLLFLVIPPLLFSYMEGWTFGEGFYFAFITLSTIGFGDYVVGE